MPDCTSKSKISCKVRCIDPATVHEVTKYLSPSGIKWLPYKCQLTGKEENILLIGNDIALRLTPSITEADNANDARILAALYSAELCECDVATLTNLSDQEVIDQLERFKKSGVITHRIIHGMNYYRLNSKIAESVFSDLVRRST